ncbi:MAG: hypothetical protein JW773_02950 [Desulfuromonadales bacterium]|nr:hypothetical protein [Desulfuromonadales bacterium]
MSLLTDLKYEVLNLETTQKADNAKETRERATFSQLYNLDIQKEIFPTLNLNFGSLFDQESSRTDRTASTTGDSESRSTAIRPFFDLQFSTALLRASTSYRKSELKESDSTAATERNFSEEYGAHLSWKPVALPELELDFTRTEIYDEPLTNEQRVDSYQLRSRYNYGFYRFTYNHTTTDAWSSAVTEDPLNPRNEGKNLNHYDSGSVRFNRTYHDGKVNVSSSLRASRQQANFSGDADRIAPTSAGGSLIGRANDPSPISSDPEDNFTLSSVDLLVDALPVEQPSFGLDFGTRTDVDRLFIYFDDLGDARSSDFSWQVYARDRDTDNWSQIAPVQDTTNLGEKRFELSFPSLSTRYIKIVTTQLAPPAVNSGEDLIPQRVEGWRTLPANTSEFTQTDWTTDLAVNWRHTDKTSTGYDFLYREQQTEPFDERKTQLSYGARISHEFNDIFLGNMRLQRSELRERDENPVISHIYSASLAARYLETFDQSLTYSFSHENDEDSQTSIANAVFLRSNLDLYQGWSLFLDNGYSWQNPGDGASSNTTFLRLGSNINPNRWLNTTFSYGVSWKEVTGEPSSQEQDGRLVVSIVPTRSISLTAELAFRDDSGATEDSTSEQRYSLNWSPFRDGTLLFTLGFGKYQDSEDEEITSLSPALRWQINRKTLLSLEYTRSEREDTEEIAKFENISLALRFFY